jgi:hypothetical protein
MTKHDDDQAYTPDKTGDATMDKGITYWVPRTVRGKPLEKASVTRRC